jgi:hypothetical protein
VKFNHIGIPTAGSFDGEIPLPHLKMTVSDHQSNPFGIQWQRYWDEAPYPGAAATTSRAAVFAVGGMGSNFTCRPQCPPR